MAKEVAVKKRALIDEANKNMFLFVAAASVALGLAIVATIYLSRYIAFNAKVIGEKAKVITDYDKSLENLPILTNSINALSENADLESIAGERDAKCQSTTLTGIEKLRECSALRIIPDALPAAQPDEDKTATTMASLGEILSQAGIVQDSLGIGDTGASAVLPGLSAVPVRFSITTSNQGALSFLTNYFERSIRTFEASVVRLEWRGVDTILLSGQQVDAYYTSPITAQLQDKTICADDKARACSRGSSRR